MKVESGTESSGQFRQIQSHDWNKLKEAKQLLKLENEMLRAKQNIVEERPLSILERIAVALEKLASK
jgi:hypothetical protein